MRNLSKFLLMIFFTAFVYLIFNIYTNEHEYVHQQNCVYHGSNANRTSFNSVYCDGSTNNDLDTINEMIASVIRPLILMLWMFGIIWILKGDENEVKIV